MEQTRNVLQNEIEAAKRKRAQCRRQILALPGSIADAISTPLAESVRLGGYIQGLQTAVTLLEKQQAQELPY